VQDAGMQQHLVRCFGVQCCSALTAWVLAWHLGVEEAGGDYGSARIR
jgi:Flp pilus assembly protein TadB